MRTKRDLNANPLLWLANIPEKHVQVYVFAPRAREAKTPYCLLLTLRRPCSDNPSLSKMYHFLHFDWQNLSRIDVLCRATMTLHPLKQNSQALETERDTGVTSNTSLYHESTSCSPRNGASYIYMSLQRNSVALHSEGGHAIPTSYSLTLAQSQESQWISIHITIPQVVAQMLSKKRFTIGVTKSLERQTISRWSCDHVTMPVDPSTIPEQHQHAQVYKTEESHKIIYIGKD